MLNIIQIKENPDKIIRGLEKKRFPDADQMVQKVLFLDEKRRNTQTELDRILGEINNLSKKIGQLMKEGDKQEADRIKNVTRDLKEDSKKLGILQDELENALENVLYNIPNVPHPEVPEGRTAEDNRVILQQGTIPELPEHALPHWELIEKYDIIDFALGNKLTGAGFPVYKNKGAKLQRALINFFLDEAHKKGYIEIQPPVVINAASGTATGQLPDKEGQMYQLKDEDFYLIPTAEVPITNIYRNVILKEEELPVKNVGYTPCFRREAGSWGAHVRGLNRLHQFDKVEIVRICRPEDSYGALKIMCDEVISLLSLLELPYRMVQLCGGDLGFTSAMTYDMEVYSAAQKKWLEVSSVSNFETFQSNRLKLRYKNQANKNILLHTLNGSALALPRIVAALLENNQAPEGIRIPAALVPYTGFEWIH
ncbi:MAG: serine--tRNA ligase [Cyclobacteriaceae bacterium]|nr:serine--tRNA ligase [Cyclobacteriaceae bacterium]